MCFCCIITVHPFKVPSFHEGNDVILGGWQQTFQDFSPPLKPVDRKWRPPEQIYIYIYKCVCI